MKTIFLLQLSISEDKDLLLYYLIYNFQSYLSHTNSLNLELMRIAASNSHLIENHLNFHFAAFELALLYIYRVFSAVLAVKKEELGILYSFKKYVENNMILNGI